MKKITIVCMVLVMLALAGCTPTATNVNTNESDDEILHEDGTDNGAVDATDLQNDDHATADDAMMDDSSEIAYQTYENRAMGYTVKIPQTWYWRHYYRTEIMDSTPPVTDYLFISPTHAITSIEIGRGSEMYIEASKQSLSDLASGVGGLNESSADFAGERAMKYAGTMMVDGLEKSVTEYHFTHNGDTYRVGYRTTADQADREKIFETILGSLMFNS